MIYPIVAYGDPVLKKPGKEINKGDETLPKFAVTVEIWCHSRLPSHLQDTHPTPTRTFSTRLPIFLQCAINRVSARSTKITYRAIWMILTINPICVYELAELLSRDKQKLSKLGKQRDGGSKKRTIHPSRKRVNSSSSNMRRKMSGRLMTQGGSGILSSFSESRDPKLSMKSRQ